MTDNLEEPLFSCSREGCREECSYPIDMLRRHNGKPICECCYDVLPYSEQALDPSDPEETLMWSDLPPFVPALIATAREVEGLRAALSDAIALIGHRMPMGTTALVAGEKLVAHDVWRAGVAALGAKP